MATVPAIPADQALAATSNEGLLRAFAALTHRMHEKRNEPLTLTMRPGRTTLTDLREQRDLVEAEVLRRMSTADEAYSAGVDAGAAQAGRVAAAAICGVPA